MVSPDELSPGWTSQPVTAAPGRRRRRVPWAELLLRVLFADALSFHALPNGFLEENAAGSAEGGQSLRIATRNHRSASGLGGMRAKGLVAATGPALNHLLADDSCI